jgi:hypothetical protein
MVAAAAACGREAPPEWPVSPPAALCHDAALGLSDFCMPAAQIERWLRSDDLSVTHAAIAEDGGAPLYKLRLEVPGGHAISVKFRRAPDDLDADGNSPRRELAAYELQKLFLDARDYVVPPTVLACLPVKKYRTLIPDMKAHGDSRCAIGTMAYWVEGITSEDAYDELRWHRDRGYRYHLANLNVVALLSGHPRGLGDDFYVSEDPRRPRLFTVDNDVAFGGVVSPFRLVSSSWQELRIPAVPARTATRLERMDQASFDRLAVVGQLQWRDGTLVVVRPTAPLDASTGVRGRGDIIQLGLTADEIDDVRERLGALLGAIDAHEVETFAAPPARR